MLSMMDFQKMTTEQLALLVTLIGVEMHKRPEAEYMDRDCDDLAGDMLKAERRYLVVIDRQEQTLRGAV